jgi:hypothetical protein
VLISAGAPLCAVYAKRIFDDVTIANDPPVGNVNAIADALLATVDRETKARTTHKASALKRQERTGDKLVTQMRTADVAEDATWRAIAKLLPAQGLTGAFTAEQDQTAIATLLRQLQADGVSAGAVKRLAAGALVASPVDLLAS